MKLLFDENVSPKLVGLVEAAFPESALVYDPGLRGATDRRIWDHARNDGSRSYRRTTISGNGAPATELRSRSAAEGCMAPSRERRNDGDRQAAA